MTGMLLVFSGLPGTGKSELAQRVGARMRIPVLSVDAIEAAIVKAGIAAGFETGLAAYLVAEALAHGQVRLGQSVIVDAVNAVEPAKAMWRALAAKHDVPLRIVECRCSDEELHCARVQARHRPLEEGIRAPTWDDVEARRLEYSSWTEPILVVDAVSSRDDNLARVVAWLGV